MFLGLAVIHVVTEWGQLDWSGYLVIDGPWLLQGRLFVIDWWYTGVRTSSGGRNNS